MFFWLYIYVKCLKQSIKDLPWDHMLLWLYIYVKISEKTIKGQPWDHTPFRICTSYCCLILLSTGEVHILLMQTSIAFRLVKFGFMKGWNDLFLTLNRVLRSIVVFHLSQTRTQLSSNPFNKHHLPLNELG